MAKEYIERERVVMGILGLTIVDPMVAQYADAVLYQIHQAPAADVVEVVRCKDCKHGVWDEDVQMCKCVFDADYDTACDEYFGFVAYEEADFYCGRGERRDDNE